MTAPSVAPAQPPHHRGEDTRKRLIEAAIEVFAVHGYEGTTTRMLVERARTNLPSIQYYFGNKEGLFRAAIDHIAGQIESRMAPVVDRVPALLADAEATGQDMLELMFALLDALLDAMTDESQPDSGRLFLARAEIENEAALEPLRTTMARRVGHPCMDLVGPLIGLGARDQETILRTLAILGQVTIFCNKGPLRALGWSGIDDDRARAIKAVLHRHTESILGAVKEGKV